MATNTSRSQNHDLSEGLTDGTYKKFGINRGGEVEHVTQLAREGMRPGNPLMDWYGFTEDPVKVRGDGQPG